MLNNIRKLNIIILAGVFTLSSYSFADQLEFKILSNKSNNTSLKCQINLDDQQIKVTFGLIEEIGSIPVETAHELEQLLVATLSNELTTTLNSKSTTKGSKFFNQLRYIKNNSTQVIIDQKNAKGPTTFRTGKKSLSLIKKVSKLCTN